MLTPRGIRCPVACVCVAAFSLLAAGCAPFASKEVVPATRTDVVVEKPPRIGGQNVVVLSRGRSGTGAQPEFLSVTLLPGRGMNTFQITAWIPGRGQTALLASPSLDDAATLLSGDAHGNHSFTLGGAFLVPFANRIRGKAVRNSDDLQVEWHKHSITLTANWIANSDGVPMAGHEAHAMHGLILDEKTDSVSAHRTADGASFTGVMHAGDFDHHWFSQSDVAVTVTLTGAAIDLQVTVTNTGKDAEPVGIGWHPYFLLPSGERSRALLHIPATDVAEVNNYDDVFPSGKLLPVWGTPLDFNARNGSKLPDKLLDDSFTNLQRAADGSATAELRDPKAKYGLRVISLSPEIHAIQCYSPPDKNFVAIEPEFNLGDPFGKEWKTRDTGMVTLKPGESTTWHVKLELFIP
jgi:aldose 1-epimerase